MQAWAYWITGQGRGEVRAEQLPAPTPDQALVRALRSGISRGTETLVHHGGVPDEVAEAMRAPFQTGDFPWPVKYGYLSVGVVEQGPQALIGRRVFTLHPHQDRYVVPIDALTLIPDAVPTERAVLAGTVETAVNAVWEAAPHYGDRVAVVGMGMVGAAITALLAEFPLSRLQLVEIDPTTAALCKQLGVDWTTPDDAATDCDIVLHCSATGAGLQTALRLAGEDAAVIEVSWFGAERPHVPLGADFHARRLQIRASQVGAIAVSRRHRRTLAQRMTIAVDALRNPRFDALLGPGCAFDDLPAFMAELTAGATVPGLCQIVRYPGPDPADTFPTDPEQRTNPCSP